MSATKLLRVEPTGVVYADPAKPDFTVRFRNNSATKSLGGVPVKNYVTEIIINDDNVVTIAGLPQKDALSVRIRASGTAESKARLKAILVSTASQLDEWSDEGVFTGFQPVTVPVNPVA